MLKRFFSVRVFASFFDATLKKNIVQTMIPNYSLQLYGTRKPVFGVYGKVSFKPVFSATQTS